DALLGGESGVEGLTGEDLTGMRNYRFAECTYRGETMLIARTGYTGEDGFELYVADELAAPLWEQLTAAGGDRLTPCGLARRRAARAGAQVRDADGREVGEITSGALSPTLGHPIAMGFVHPSAAEVGTELVADVRGKDLPVRVVETPFRTRD